MYPIGDTSLYKNIDGMRHNTVVEAMETFDGREADRGFYAHYISRKDDPDKSSGEADVR